jgi:hypothetical protein
MDAFRNRFSPSFQWIFALAAIVLGVAVAFATKSMSPKVTAAVYGAVVASAGFAASYATTAKLRSTVGIFFLASVVVGIGYYFLVSHFAHAAMDSFTDVTVAAGGNPSAKANGAQAAGVMGNFFGIVAGAVGFIETFVGGVVGAMAGHKFKEQSQHGNPAYGR